MQPAIDLAVTDELETDGDRLYQLASNAVQATVEVAGLKIHQDAELSVLVADDPTLRALNLEWRGIDKPTNVLSFPGSELSAGDPSDPVLGDIAISFETVWREAALENKQVDAHFLHLIIHGFLHLFGYDHETEEQADEMEGLEIRILEQLGIANPYD